MKLSDKSSPVGTLTVRIINDKTGELISESVHTNLIVNSGKSGMAHLLGQGGTYDDQKVYRLSVGTDGTNPTPGDTTITDPFTKVLDGVTYPDATSVLFAWSISGSEANGKNIREFGLLKVDNSLFARRVRALITKDASLRLEGTWKIQF